MELRLLGPLEAIDGRGPLALGGPKPRALLTRLALDVNRTVGVPRLIDDLWGEAAPESAVKMVQIYVSQLRKVLPEGALRTRAPGYVLELEPDALDVTRFATLHRAGRAALADGDPEAAATRLREALALWPGPALAEFSEPFARVEAAHLESCTSSATRSASRPTSLAASRRMSWASSKPWLRAIPYASRSTGS